MFPHSEIFYSNSLTELTLITVWGNKEEIFEELILSSIVKQNLGVRPAGIGKQDHILPKHLCQRLFNIYHPSDPIAYRLEPLVLKNYSTKAPLEIQKSSEFTKSAQKEQTDKRAPLKIDLKSALTKTPSIKSSFIYLIYVNSLLYRISILKKL